MTGKIYLSLRTLLISLLLVLYTFALLAQNFRPFLDASHRFSSKKESFLLQSNHVSTVSNVEHSYLIQTYDSIPVFNAVMSIHLLPDGELLALHDQFIKDLNSFIYTPAQMLSADSILTLILREVGMHTDTKPILKEAGMDKLQTYQFYKTDALTDDISIKLIYYPAENGEVRLSRECYIHKAEGAEWWHVIADAESGMIHYKHNLYISCNFGDKAHPDCRFHNHKMNERSSASFKPAFTNSGSYNVFPLGIESPSHGNRMIVVNPADPVASPYGWHDTNGQPGHEFTTTKGNNVEAREDLDGNNNTLGAMANGGPNLNFDFPLNLSIPPVQNQNASITNLFYWNNIMHDIWYRYGFTEAAGNFQQNNYGNGGSGNDFVSADAMDGSGTNNANFATPVDGSNPRMQMFIWNASSTSQFTVNTPQAAAGNYTTAVAGFGPSSFNISGQVILANDGTSSPTLACNPLTNAAAISGNIALIDRGTCEFGAKCLNAQNAGAIAVIICNNVSGAPFSMAPGAVGNQVNIPCVMISQADCNLIRVHIPNLTVTITATGNLQLDSDFDSGVIAHEYGHGISIRLTGGAANSSCLNNQEQMGEGWSDWFGLMLTIKPEDTHSTPRGIGTFLINQPINGVGIRKYPYTTDMDVNPMTYDTIKTLAAPHGVGSVWCTMLWDMTWNLIKEYGYDPDLYTGNGGNNIAMKLVTEALKLQPCSPGFVSGRNAILQADVAIYGGKNQCLIWEAFAKRGLGFSAQQGATNNKNDGTQAFDMPASCCRYVMNTSDNGTNSLRSAINCAAPGDTILISPNLYGSTINLTSNTLNINKNINVIVNPNKELTVAANGNFAVFTIQNNNNVILDNLTLIAGNGPNNNGRAVMNSGNLTLKNITIIDNNLQNGGSSVMNEGSLQVQGLTHIK